MKQDVSDNESDHQGTDDEYEGDSSDGESVDLEHIATLVAKRRSDNYSTMRFVSLSAWLCFSQYPNLLFRCLATFPGFGSFELTGLEMDTTVLCIFLCVQEQQHGLRGSRWCGR